MEDSIIFMDNACRGGITDKIEAYCQPIDIVVKLIYCGCLGGWD